MAIIRQMRGRIVNPTNAKPAIIPNPAAADPNFATILADIQQGIKLVIDALPILETILAAVRKPPAAPPAPPAPAAKG